MVFGSALSSFGEKNRKKVITSTLSFGQNLSNSEKRSFEPENVSFCEKCFLAVI